ncbi:MAG: polysaccharide deacetylase family protein [Leptospiraceae bacterium]|nr:polysaccharide deacetylase family protein [Leptospiraceae bacterium]MCP5496071.1 polysaccharide deacetylase family protein [Leptospiraceae bacterium]
MKKLLSILFILVLFPKSYFSEVKPNELGKIMVLAYHHIGEKDTLYTRRKVSFINDLHELKKGNFVPLKVSHLEKKMIDVPKGKKPILLTFDDSSLSQFEMYPDGSLNPDCALGIMEKFKKDNPDFPITATFFVLPGASYPSNLFGQPEITKKKMEFLIKNGYEVASHTLWHANLKTYKDKIPEQLAEAQKLVNKYLLGYRLRSLAMPYGIYPPKEYFHKLQSGTYKGTSYNHILVFDYSNRLSLSPFDSEFDVIKVHRVQAFEDNIQKFIKMLDEKSLDTYISDGNMDTITIPKELENKLDKSLTKKFKIIVQ